jgi:hypothetical protein
MPPLNIARLIVGKEYTRPELAEIWGYLDWHGFARGVFTPKGQSLIVLFVTREKQESLTQYEDHFEGDDLHWEGERGNRNDDRIIEADSNGDRIVLLYRDKHHLPFTYYGPLRLKSHRRIASKPTRFVFATNGVTRVTPRSSTGGRTQPGPESPAPTRR